MPWKDVNTMDERTRFISRLLDGDRMVDLCREFGISRKTGYKFWDRYQKEGPGGLSNALKAPLRTPHKTDPTLEKLILKLRTARPTWGPKKLKAKLESLHPGLEIPAHSTIGEVLKRNGYIEMRRRRKKTDYFPSHELSEGIAPNDVWCVDFKGQFRLGNGTLCYPLTITDYYSRFLICCEALESVRTQATYPAFEAVFRQYGIPKIIRSDNGVPFSSQGLAGLSRLSAWWMRLGIRPERTQPGHPEQNGRHERMHLTLKKEATRPAKKTILQQQEVFDRFKEGFNFDRPHEALAMKVPGDLYISAERKFPEELPQPDYSTYDVVRTVSTIGGIRVPKTDKRCFIARALTGHKVGLREIGKNAWQINFSGTDLGFITQAERNFFLSLDNPLAPPEE